MEYMVDSFQRVFKQKKNSFTKSVKENATKIRTNLDHKIKKHPTHHTTQNGQQSTTLSFPELREQMRRSNREMKRAVMEKCYQNFDKRLYVPWFVGMDQTTHSVADSSSNVDENPTHSVVPGHADIAVEYDSIFYQEYSVASEAWMGALAEKNICLVKEILFETIMTCYYFMICEKANILKKWDKVENDQKVYLTLAEFEKTLCQHTRKR